MKPMNEVIAEALEVETDTLNAYTNDFRQHPNWDSLAALNLIVLIDQYYSYPLEADQMKNAVSINDLENLISKN